ncbi:MAG: hypothetical protein QNJ40_08460 [Xanthomonadales bacterium]|nr:hypothetical protein [Xanthomonadales bacterium]
MKRFVPVTDSLVELNQTAKLVPYRVGLPCLHWEIVNDRPLAETLLGEEPPRTTPRGP